MDKTKIEQEIELLDSEFGRILNEYNERRAELMRQLPLRWSKSIASVEVENDTDMLIRDAGRYFKNHIDGNSWKNIEYETCYAAVMVASKVVMRELKIATIDRSRIFQMYAIFELALFLATSDAGRRFLMNEDDIPVWPDRALRFIECEKNLFERKPNS